MQIVLMNFSIQTVCLPPLPLLFDRIKIEKDLQIMSGKYVTTETWESVGALNLFSGTAGSRLFRPVVFRR